MLPGAWAPEDRNHPSLQLWKSLSRLFGSAESVSSVPLLSELALGRHGKSPFQEDVVGKLRDEVKVLLAREGIQFERMVGDRSDVPIDFRLLGGLLQAAADLEVSIASFAQGCAGRPGIQNATLPETLHEEEKVADPGAERTGGR